MNLTNKLDLVRSEYLSRMTRGQGQLLQVVEAYVSAHSGKLLRPRMLLLAAASRGQEQAESQRTLLLAVAVEMLHNASLLHDDVIDRAETRRGHPSVNARWGNAAAVLVGDYLLAQIMQLLNEIDDGDAARLINATVAEMVEAELLALQLQGQAPTREQYLRIIDGKTARLFATAAALGNPALEAYGLHYGRLFQLLDDTADGEATVWTPSLIAAERQTLSQLAQQGQELDMPLQ